MSAAKQRLSYHILPTAGTMVGVCTTLIGLVKIAEARSGPSRVDEYAAVTALFFLSSALLSYLALRNGEASRYGLQCERLADGFFLVGLLTISLLSLLFAYEVV